MINFNKKLLFLIKQYYTILLKYYIKFFTYQYLIFELNQLDLFNFIYLTQ